MTFYSNPVKFVTLLNMCQMKDVLFYQIFICKNSLFK